MIQPVSKDEIKAALMTTGDDKAPGLGGYTAKFFKNAWNIVGDEVSKAVQYFFETKKIYPAIC